MVTTARASRSSAQHNRMRRRVRELSEEVERLNGHTVSNDYIESATPALYSVPRVESSNGLESLLDRALELTKGWEKIASLVALITTNISGNKTLGPLLDILAKDKIKVTDGEASQTAGTGSLNISDLLGMAETILKTGQLPAALVPPSSAQAQEPLASEEVQQEKDVEPASPITGLEAPLASEPTDIADDEPDVVESINMAADGLTVDESMDPVA